MSVLPLPAWSAPSAEADRPPATGTSLPAAARPDLPAPPVVSADAAVVLDWRTGQVLYAKDAYRAREPASTTKIVTAIVILERAALSDQVVVSRNAAWTVGSSMPLQEGQVVTVGELLWGILLRSANNGCVAAAEHIAGSEAAFVQLMNEKAEAIGARSTHFRNSNGLTAPGHLTSAYDLALIARYGLRIPAFEAIVRSRDVRLDLGPGGSESQFRSTNRLLWVFAGADGVKTGTTDAAGQCLVASATRDGRRLISVVLHSDDRYADTERLLSWGFQHFTTILAARAEDQLASVEVRGGVHGVVAAAPERDFWVTCPLWATESLGYNVHLIDGLRAPVRRGQVVGVAEAVLGDEVVQAVNLVATTDIAAWTPERTFLRLLLPVIRLLAGLGLG